jgi:hypothetical protein
LLLPPFAFLAEIILGQKKRIKAEVLENNGEQFSFRKFARFQELYFRSFELG